MTPNPVPFVVISAVVISLIFLFISPVTTMIVVGIILLLMFIFAPAWAFFNIIITPIYFVGAWGYKIGKGIFDILFPKLKSRLQAMHPETRLARMKKLLREIF